MRKHIDADDIINVLREMRTKYLIQSVFGEDMRDNVVIAGTLEAVAQILDGLPAADVVEVVRCKDCKWFGDIGCAIRIVDDSDRPSENDFCSFAERKDNDKTL